MGGHKKSCELSINGTMVHKTAEVDGFDVWNEMFYCQVKDTNSQIDFKVIRNSRF